MNPREFVEHFGIRSLVCCFSGGKDSLVSTHYTLQSVEGLPDLDTYVVHVDTTIGLPGVQDYVREVADPFGWNLVILRPERSFFDHVAEKGMPRMRVRWCCYHLKLKPIFDFTKDLEAPRVEVTGLRRAESTRRRRCLEWYYHRKALVFKYAPLAAWSDRQVRDYIRDHDLPINPIYDLIDISGECICGAFTSKRNLRLIAARFPEFFNQFVEAERAFRSGGSAFWKSGKPLRASDLAKQKTLDEAIAR